MFRSDVGSMLQYLRGLSAADNLGDIPDRQLVERFVAFHEQDAYAALLQRHGPMVLGVCRRVLRKTQDAEDAFQATFLLLASRARDIRSPDAVGGWLYGVARRVALKLRCEATRRSSGNEAMGRPLQEVSRAEPTARDPMEELTWKELRTAVDEELERLPAELRAPLILCYLEGRTQDEGARQLGMGVRLFRRRLEKGRAVLSRRLARRGVSLSMALFATLLAPETLAMPASLWVPLVRSAAALAGGGTGGGVSSAATGLAATFGPSLAYSKSKLLLVLLLTVNLAATGLGVFLAAGGTERQLEPPRREAPPDRRAADAVPPGVELVGTKAVLNGQVVDDSGRPVANARVAALARRPYRPGEHGLRQDVLGQGKTGADGRFRLTVPADFPTWYAERQLAVWVSAPGHGPGTLAVPVRAGQPNLFISLGPNRPLRGRLVDPNARPLVGVSVEVVRIGNVLREIVQTTEAAAKPVNGKQAPGAAPATSDIPFDLWPAPARTDADGFFELPGLGTVRNVWLQIHDDRFALETFPAEFSDGRPIDGQPYAIVLLPGQLVEGTVTAADTGKPIAHARLTAVSPMELTAEQRYALHTTAQEAARRAAVSEFDARADDQGRFRLRLPTGRYFRIEAHAPPGSPWLALSRLITRNAGERCQPVQLALQRGVLVTGFVHDAANGRPVPGAIAYYLPANNDSRPGGDTVYGPAAHVVADANGRFRLAVPPGRGRICIHTDGGDFVARRCSTASAKVENPCYAHGVVDLDLAPNRDAAEVDVALHRGVSITGKVVGPDGQAVAAGLLVSAGHVHPLNPASVRPLPLTNGGFILPGCVPGRMYRVLFLNAERSLGAVVDLAADKTQHPVLVRLQPCGQAMVSFFDGNHRPLANQLLTPFVLLEPDIDASADAAARARRTAAAVEHETTWADPLVYSHCLGPHTEADGHITLIGLVPGARYGLRARGVAPGRLVTKPFTVEPGEFLRLPDVSVSDAPGRAVGAASGEKAR